MLLGFSTRIALLMTAILGIAIIATGALSLHKYERTLTDFMSSRFEFMVKDIRQRIETEMDLGLPLADLQDVSERLARHVRNDEQILSIEIFDDSGTVLHSADPSYIGDLVVEDWMSAWRANLDRGAWSTLHRHAGVVGVPLRNNLDQDVGSVALRYSRDFLDERVSSQTSRLLIIGGLVVLCMSLICILGTFGLLRSANQGLRHLRSAMEDVRLGRLDNDVVEQTRSQHPEFAAFAATTVGAHEALDSALADVRSLDEEGTA